MSNNRALERKATIEIQRRPGRVGTVTAQRTRGGALDNGYRGSSFAADTNSVINSSILTEVYAPDGFDEKSTILACNFPPGFTTHQCRIFFSWIGSVIRVDRAPSLARESNFIVVFATADHAKLASSLQLTYEENEAIETRMIQEKDTIWKKISGFFWGAI